MNKKHKYIIIVFAILLILLIIRSIFLLDIFSNITIDGFSNTYEYALINDKELEIIYLYLSYPNINNLNYNNYLKKNKKEYSKNNTINMFSMYNHLFDNGNSFAEFDDC